MLNQIVLVGRITQDPKVTELDNGKKVCNVTIAIPRSYKNENGEYDTDFVKCTMWSGVAENTSEYCKVVFKQELLKKIIQNKLFKKLLLKKLHF